MSSPRRSHTSRLSAVGPYEFVKTLGRGVFGKVKLAVHVESKKKVAIKIIEKEKLDSNTLRMVRREVMIMKLLDHPNIINLYEVLEGPDHVFIVMEYAPGGEVIDFIIAHGKLHEKLARQFFRQVVYAIDYCHSLHVIHRDLKPENLLLDANFRIKIIDFGLSNVYNPGEFLKTFCGSPTYSAPELVEQQAYHGVAIDVWSLGVVLFVLVCGFLPFDGNSFTELFTKIVKGDYRIPSFVSPDCADLIQRMLVVDPAQRATIDEVRVHTWLLYNGQPVPKAVVPDYITNKSPSSLDQAILDDLASMGYDREAVVRSVLSGAFDDEAATYYLLCAWRERRKPSKNATGSSSSVGSKSVSPHARQSQAANSGSPADSRDPISTSAQDPEAVSAAQDARGSASGKRVRPLKNPSSKYAKARHRKVRTWDENENKSGASSSPASVAPTLVTPDASPYKNPSLNPGTSPHLNTSTSTTTDQVSEAHIAPIAHLVAVKGPSEQIPTLSHPSSSPLSDSLRRRKSKSSRDKRSRPRPRPNKATVNRPQTRHTLHVPRVASRRSGRNDDHDDDNNNDMIIPFPSLSPRNPPRKVYDSASSERAMSELITSFQTTFEIATLSEASSSPVPYGKHKEDPAPRQARFPVNSDTTTDQSPELVLSNLRHLLEKRGVLFTATNEFCLECKNDKVTFELEICSIENLSVHGIRFHRLSGDVWEYGKLCKEILTAFNLGEAASS